MADQRANVQSGGFADAVCIDTGRVYDSCMDKDCLEDVKVFFSESGQQAIQHAICCRVKSAEVVDVLIDVEPVTFNRGFFSCDLTFFFLIKCEVTTSPCHCPIEICGIAAFSKKVILCGGEGAVKKFSSQTRLDEIDGKLCPSNNLPKCTVECVDPVVLDSKICEVCHCACETSCAFPCGVLRNIGGEICDCGDKHLFVTLGLFSIVQLIRNVQLLIPVYDFCVPEKECTVTNDNPCDLFSKIQFPIDEFFPPADMCNQNGGCSC